MKRNMIKKAVAVVAAVGLAAGISVSTAGTAAAEGWAVQPAGTYPISERAIPYWDNADPTQQMDVYYPSGDSAPAGRPVLVFIHGGGYFQGDKASFTGYAKQVASMGYIAVNINYRLSDARYGGWPGQMQDLSRALLWTRSHAVTWWQGDPTRIGLIGTSAGGHLALMGQNEEGVKAVAVWSPMLDLYEISYGSRKGTELAYHLINDTARCSFQECPDKWGKDFRPDGFYNTRSTVPIYATNSSNELIWETPLINYRNAVRSRGGIFNVDIIYGTAHATGDAYMAVAWPKSLAHMEAHL